MARRVTMSDIAERAGVSRVAVSYALNGRPGVSDEVRARILGIAEEIGFAANAAAKALKGALARTVGLALRTPAPGQGVGAYHRGFISGLQAELAARQFGLALQFVPGADEELALYRRWHAEQRVDGVVVGDLAADDPRPAAVTALGLPAVVVGGPVDAPGLAQVWVDEQAAAGAVAGHLAALGHDVVVQVGGGGAWLANARRTHALAAACAAAGLRHTVIATDQTGAASAQATRRVLSGAQRPGAVVYDNDVMAVAGLGVAMEMGVPVPAALSVLSWEDSPLCQVVRPALTALAGDVTGYGAAAARELLASIDGEPPGSYRHPDATLVIRASTGPAV